MIQYIKYSKILNFNLFNMMISYFKIQELLFYILNVKKIILNIKRLES